MLKVLGVEAGDRRKVARWVGVGMWVVVVIFTCVGGKIAEKIELVGLICAIAVGWFLPGGFSFCSNILIYPNVLGAQDRREDHR